MSNIKKIRHHFSFIACVTAATLFTSSLFAVTNTTTAATNANPSLICPPINVIKKSTNPSKSNWTAETTYGKWKSYDLSFATNLTKFVGAQWTGERVGQITCIYDSEQKFKMQGESETQPTLPVLLVFHTLTFQPTGGKWQKLTKSGRAVRGVRNCYSNQQKDCPFQMHMKAPTGNVLEEAESLKSPSGTTSSNPLGDE